jgi:hypothetical protein
MSGRVNVFNQSGRRVLYGDVAGNVNAENGNIFVVDAEIL